MTAAVRHDQIQHRIGREGVLTLSMHDGAVRLVGRPGEDVIVRSTDGGSLDGLAVERVDCVEASTCRSGGAVGVPETS